jgi:hypothetical protein
MQKTPVTITAILFFWAGFVSSISFMEAWLKFQAPGVTLATGLSIGKLIFTALNRVEWLFLVLLAIHSILSFKKLPLRHFYLSAAVFVFLAVQTFWLLPELSHRAEQIIAGNTPGESIAHLLFGITEVLKVITLIYLGFLSASRRND